MSEPKGTENPSHAFISQKEIRSRINTAREEAIQNLKKAGSTTDYLKWHTAVLQLTPEYSAWMFDYEPRLTSRELVDDFNDPEKVKRYEKEAKAAEKMRAMIDQLSENPQKIRIAIKRWRDEGRYSYRVLAAFPSGTRIYEPIADMVLELDSNRRIDFIYFDPENACVDHACDDLYKTHRGDKGAVFEIDNRTLREAMRGLRQDSGGTIEYQLEKTETKIVKQDTENFVLVGLMGGFSNEPSRVRISDLWVRNPS